MMPPGRLVEIILGPAIGTSRQVLFQCFVAPLAYAQDQCQDTASRFLARCEDNTDLIGLCWAISSAANWH
jgi:hypothetical protein